MRESESKKCKFIALDHTQTKKVREQSEWVPDWSNDYLLLLMVHWSTSLSLSLSSSRLYALFDKFFSSNSPTTNNSLNTSEIEEEERKERGERMMAPNLIRENIRPNAIVFVAVVVVVVLVLVVALFFLPSFLAFFPFLSFPFCQPSTHRRAPSQLDTRFLAVVGLKCSCQVSSSSSS